MFNKENIFPTKPIKTIKELTPYIPLLENLMLTNRTQEEISSALMCDLAVLNEYAYLTYELPFLDLLETFKARSNALLLDKQYEKALEGDNKMLIFLGKNYAKQTDTDKNLLLEADQIIFKDSASVNTSESEKVSED